MTLSITIPGDKSLTHRALMFAALAEGRSRIRTPLVGADTESTAACLRALGCDVPDLSAPAIVVEGRGLHGLVAPADVLDCGNSGTTARLLMGILAGHPLAATLTGDASLCSRPMRRVTGPLAEMGASFEELGAQDRLPVRIRGGGLRALDYDSPHASAQVKSAILLAGLCGAVTVSVREPLLSRDHTERMLLQLGVPLERATDAEGRASVRLSPVQQLAPLDFDVPGDFSSAAFALAMACLGRVAILVRNVGINPTRTGFLDVLRRMGADVQLMNVREACGEPVADLHAAPSSLRAVRIDGAEVPSLVDEIPVIAALAARAEGTTVIEGAAELRVKESDRIAAMVRNLRAVGALAEELPDGMVIHGSDAPLAGEVAALHDHRIAMAFGVLAAGGAEIRVDDPGVVGVSFPRFWDLMHQVQAA